MSWAHTVHGDASSCVDQLQMYQLAAPVTHDAEACNMIDATIHAAKWMLLDSGDFSSKGTLTVVLVGHCGPSGECNTSVKVSYTKPSTPVVPKAKDIPSVASAATPIVPYTPPVTHE